MTKYLCSGALVKSMQGRDAEKLYIILKVDGDFAYVVNGSSRPIEQPKKKNLKHLYLLCKSEIVGLKADNYSNLEIYEFIKNYNKSRDYK